VGRDARPAPRGRLLEDEDDSYLTCNDDDCPTGKEQQFYAWVLVLMGGFLVLMAVDWLVHENDYAMFALLTGAPPRPTAPCQALQRLAAGSSATTVTLPACRGTWARIAIGQFRDLRPQARSASSSAASTSGRAASTSARSRRCRSVVY
jgi:hypothetical protein